MQPIPKHTRIVELTRTAVLAAAIVLISSHALAQAQAPSKPAAATAVATPAVAPEVARGEYLIKAGGCLGCHTAEKKDAVPFAGGRALKTPFGTFYGPNITPHPTAGIGGWTEAQFVRAMRHGERPDGANYFPAFPYPSFTKIKDADLRDLWAYLRSLP
ncbi:MAG: cytochrome c, partial [Betaproteobacteria bacterium]